MFLGSKITADGGCSHEIKRRLLFWRKAMTNQDSISKSRDITLPTKVHLAKAMVFPEVMHRCERWTIKKPEHQRNDAFALWCWRLLRVLWTSRRSNQSIVKEISPEYSLEGLLLKLKLQYFDHLIWRTDSLEKTLGKMLGKTEGKRRRGWQRMRRLDGVSHDWLNGHDLEQALGIGDGQGRLACYSPWGCIESATTELNWNPEPFEDSVVQIRLLVFSTTSLVLLIKVYKVISLPSIYAAFLSSFLLSIHLPPYKIFSCFLLSYFFILVCLLYKTKSFHFSFRGIWRGSICSSATLNDGITFPSKENHETIPLQTNIYIFSKLWILQTILKWPFSCICLSRMGSLGMQTDDKRRIIQQWQPQSEMHMTQDFIDCMHLHSV